MKSCIFILSVYTFIILLFPQNAFGYIDPGSGSYILQMILAALLGGLVAIKMFFASIKAFFISLFSKNRDDDNDLN